MFLTITTVLRRLGLLRPFGGPDGQFPFAAPSTAHSGSKTGPSSRPSVTAPRRVLATPAYVERRDSLGTGAAPGGLLRARRQWSKRSKGCRFR